MIYSKRRQSFGLIAILLGIASLAAAQDYRGKVQGFVADANDAAIAGAQVVLRNARRDTFGEGPDFNRGAHQPRALVQGGDS